MKLEGRVNIYLRRLLRRITALLRVALLRRVTALLGRVAALVIVVLAGHCCWWCLFLRSRSDDMEKRLKKRRLKRE